MAQARRRLVFEDYGSASKHHQSVKKRCAYAAMPESETKNSYLATSARLFVLSLATVLLVSVRVMTDLPPVLDIQHCLTALTLSRQHHQNNPLLFLVQQAAKHGQIRPINMHMIDVTMVGKAISKTGSRSTVLGVMA